MKVTTEKLPKSLLALDIEMDRARVEKGLDRAARRISQKVNIPGFRKGKAPRFIVENYYGRAVLIEEATEDLINRTFREVLEQERIEPVGRASVEEVHFSEEPYHFRVTVPVPPTVKLPDYRAIRVGLEEQSVSDEMLQQALDARRERHVVLRAPEEPRGAQEGDQLTVQLETFVDGEPLEQSTEVPSTTLVMEPKRLAPGLFEGLLGIESGETREVTVHMPEEHANEQVRDKDVTFKVTVNDIQERLLPEWDELPVLEEFEGTLDELREHVRDELVQLQHNQAEREAVDSYVKQLVEQTDYDIPDALVEQEAIGLLEDQGRQFERYGITLDQMLQYRGQTREEAAHDLKPQAEEQLKNRLALLEIVRNEGLTITNQEIDEEVGRIVESYKEQERDVARNMFSTQLRPTVANSVLNQKLRERLVAIATGTAPALAGPDDQHTPDQQVPTTPDAEQPGAESSQGIAETVNAEE